MREFGDFANIDIDKLLNDADSQIARMGSLQEDMAKLVGRAQDEDELVTVEYTAEGLRTLDIHPKAMRLSSSELAEKIKAVLQDASQDLQVRMSAAMGETFGEEMNPMKFIADPDVATDRLKSAEAVYQRTFEDAMGELDRIRRRLE
ncbi:YbaB/EbfC family nucleoid-associated protein [Streptosporangium amethystogenes]|uniref:YbaB/EbfC family nucleoid-associated protein n=1 Tax=Streptosporangium amethystogenes TaxID=2002 RepID=UPI0004C5BDF1|nr:YbaB/EbfC family nucleoid-associated protein [Streptosporangium amethystogenes]